MVWLAVSRQAYNKWCNFQKLDRIRGIQAPAQPNIPVRFEGAQQVTSELAVRHTYKGQEWSPFQTDILGLHCA